MPTEASIARHVTQYVMPPTHVASALPPHMMQCGLVLDAVGLRASTRRIIANPALMLPRPLARMPSGETGADPWTRHVGARVPSGRMTRYPGQGRAFLVCALQRLSSVPLFGTALDGTMVARKAASESFMCGPFVS